MEYCEIMYTNIYTTCTFPHGYTVVMFTFTTSPNVQNKKYTHLYSNNIFKWYVTFLYLLSLLFCVFFPVAWLSRGLKTLELKFFVAWKPAKRWKAGEWRELTWPCVLDKAAQWHWLVWLVRSKTPQGSAVDHTEWKQARQGGNKEERVRSRTMIDMDDSSQSDVSPCQPSHAPDTHAHTHTHTHTDFQRHTVGQDNTHIFLPSSLLTPLSCWSLGLHFNAPVTTPFLYSASGIEVENARGRSLSSACRSWLLRDHSPSC